MTSSDEGIQQAMEAALATVLDGCGGDLVAAAEELISMSMLCLASRPEAVSKLPGWVEHYHAFWRQTVCEAEAEAEDDDA